MGGRFLKLQETTLGVESYWNGSESSADGFAGLGMSQPRLVGCVYIDICVYIYMYIHSIYIII